MRKLCSLALLLCLVGMAGCNNQKANLLASLQTFISTVSAMTALHAAGKLSPAEVNEVSVYIHTGQACLKTWYEQDKAGKVNPSVIAQFNAVLDEMIRLQAAKQ